ncbi:hypothetical protein HYX58_00195 [Candidatus Dependentiae bacterium]|nr:hypothetical protein [Candidatus Dependentiae bacterium]
MKRIGIVFLLSYLCQTQAVDAPSFYEIPEVATNLCKNHPYTSAAMITGLWVLLNYIAQDPEDSDSENLTKNYWFNTVFLGVLIDLVLNKERSVPGIFAWIAKEYSERSIITFVPWLTYESISRLVAKFFSTDLQR